MPLLEPGQKLGETYEVERLLGEGAFAEVYRVRHRFMGRQALKVFKASGATLADIERDLAEAVLLSNLRHPNIVEVYDANVHEGPQGRLGYFTMTYVAGGTLERHWRSFGRNLMPVEQAVEILRQACRGLAVAHGATPPIVHRDIKPQNILVGYSPNGLHVRMSDFGLAKSVNPLTQLVSAQGTPAFKPPEALDDADSCSGDIWSLGTTLYLLLTDEMPFPLLNERDVHDATRFLRPMRPPSIYNVNVDGALESILYRCLATSPAHRYRDAAELLRDLERWSPGQDPAGAAVSQSSRGLKSAIVQRSPHDLPGEARRGVAEALELAKDYTRLMAAADLMEEALSKDPDLRARYEWQLHQWRKGIMHAPAPGVRGQASGPKPPAADGGGRATRRPEPGSIGDWRGQSPT